MRRRTGIRNTINTYLAIPKKETRLKLQFVANSDHTIHAGLVAVEAMARRFGLWEKMRDCRCLDPRKDRKRGYSPEVMVGQLICALCSGGGCLSDSEALNEDPLARELFGVGRFADQSQAGEWLRLLYVGRLEWQKDLLTLLRAFQLINRCYKDVKLLIVGQGSFEKELRLEAQNLGIESNVVFLGGIDHKAIFSYYYSSDIFVISSKLEGRPNGPYRGGIM